MSGPRMIVLADGTRRYLFEMLLHRADGPAIEWANGDRAWYRHGVRHRAAGPAVDNADGSRQWWLNGLRHREDGPAIECSDGCCEWWLQAREMPFSEWLKAVARTEEERVSLLMRWG